MSTVACRVATFGDWRLISSILKPAVGLYKYFFITSDIYVYHALNAEMLFVGVRDISQNRFNAFLAQTVQKRI